MSTNNKRVFYLSLFAILASHVGFGANTIFDRRGERPEQNQKVEVDTAPYETQVKQLEQGIAQLKLNRDADTADVIRFSDMNFRINYLEVKLDKTKKAIKDLKSTRNSKDADEKQKTIELQLADVQANLYGTKAE